MKKVIFILVLFVIFSCKKNNSSNNNSNNTNVPKVVTTFSVDGHSVGDSISHNSFLNSGNFGIIAYKTAGAELQITFSNSLTPTDGAYSIISGTATYQQCTFIYSDTGYSSHASHGVINITTSTVALNNVATFSNIAVSGNAGGHTLAGTIAY